MTRFQKIIRDREAEVFAARDWLLTVSASTLEPGERETAMRNAISQHEAAVLALAHEQSRPRPMGEFFEC